MKTIDTTKADNLTTIAVQQVKTSTNFKRDRMAQIQQSEEFYYGRKIVVPKGRFGVPLPVMSGFVDELMSKIDDPPVIKYGYTDLADLKLAKKVSLACEKDSSPIRSNWPMKDRWSKKLACFSGRSIQKYFAESDPKYKSNLEVVDHEDFHCEPAGGGHLEKHLFCGQENIFRTKADLKAGSKMGLYDATQVNKLIAAVNNTEYKTNEDLWSKKSERYKSLGLNLSDSTYIGQSIFRLIEWAMEYEGKRYYLLFDYRTGIWVRAQELKDVFESDLYPWFSWATHEDPFLFWSKAPCDDVRPVADAIDVLFNQALDNRQKQNMGQRAYDPDIFPDPSELEWRPDGLVRATASEKGKAIQQGIYEFKTPEIGGTIDFIAFMDSFTARKTGISPNTQGVPEKDQKVGIHFSQLEQMADRLGLYNKSYRESWSEQGIRYAWGCREHLSENEMIKMIGEEGIEWHKEKNKVSDLNIDIKGGSAEIMANEAKAKKRENAFLLLLKRPDLTNLLNPQWFVQELLHQGAYEEAEIKIATSRDEMGDMELMSEAAQAIQDIVAGKEVKLNRGANTAFIQKIIDFASDNEMKIQVYQKLMVYAQSHIPIAQQNMIRKARMMMASQGMNKPEQGREPAMEETAGGPGRGISEGGKASNLLQGNSPLPAL